MTEPAYDLLIRGGRVATVSDVFEADVAISGETIAAIGRGLPGARREIDARGKLVLPGGVDSHAHIEQLSAAGIVNADTFESATVSAAFGGTTTVISFAAQHVGMKLPQVVEEYHALARKGAVIDYAFHMIIADPTEETLEKDVPALVKQGHGSIKIFMTYDRLKVDDEPLLDVLLAARDNRRDGLRPRREPRHDLVDGQAAASQHGYTDAEISTPSAIRASREAGGLQPADRAGRAGRPADHDLPRLDRRRRGGDPRRRAAQGLKVFAETCPQYLFLTEHDLDKPGLEGAKWMCSPPPRRRRRPGGAVAGAGARRPPDRLVRSRALRFDETGKLLAGPNPNFKQIAERHAGAGGAACRCCSTRWCRRGDSGLEKVRRIDLDQSGEDLQPVSAQGHARDRRRRRHRDLGPASARSRFADAMMQD